MPVVLGRRIEMDIKKNRKADYDKGWGKIKEDKKKKRKELRKQCQGSVYEYMGKTNEKC